MLRRIVLVTAVAVGSIPLWAGAAHACSCVQMSSRDALREFPVVFAGTVTGASDPEGNDKIVSSAQAVTYTFDVDSAAKGDVERTMDVNAARGGASCGIEFDEATRYLVFAYRENSGDLWTNVCTTTQELPVTQGAPFPLHPLDAPPRRHDPGVPLVPIAAAATAAAAVAGAGVFLWARRRS